MKTIAMTPFRALILAAALLLPAAANAQPMRNLEADVAAYKASTRQSVAQPAAQRGAPQELMPRSAITSSAMAATPRPEPQADAAPASLGLVEPAAGNAMPMAPLASPRLNPEVPAPEVYVRRSDGMVIPAVTAPVGQ